MNNNMELISIIVPVYNVSSVIEKCIDSILDQTYKNIEIIIIDDGSTDGSSTICEKYKSKYENIILVHKKNGGLSNARNLGIDLSNGRLICFIDSDDYIEPTMIEELYYNLMKYDSDISICDYYLEYDMKINKPFDKEEFFLTDKNKFIFLENEYGRIVVCAWNKLYKKELFNNSRFPEGKLFEDVYIIHELLDNSQKISFVLKPLYNYVYRTNSISNVFTQSHFDKIDAYNNRIDYYNNRLYFDLALKTKKQKLETLLVFIPRMFLYKIDKNIKIKYYKELIKTNKEILWKDANRKIKYYKIFRQIYIQYRIIIELLLIRVKNNEKLLRIIKQNIIFN
jgi:glycosyltransferase involved in cell wall biosynthesis